MDSVSTIIRGCGRCLVREVDKLGGRLPEEVVVAGLCEADNLHPWPAVVVQSKTLAQGILARPVVLDELLVHHGHSRSIGGIGCAEAAAFDDRQSPSCRSSARSTLEAKNRRALLANGELKSFRQNRGPTCSRIRRPSERTRRARLISRRAPIVRARPPARQTAPPAARCSARGRG